MPSLVSYFEVNVLPGQQYAFEANGKSCIAVGITLNKFKWKSSMPGWERLSYGYHSDDGSTFGSRKKTLPFGPKFGVGDIVGCGVDYSKRQVFYTLNGKFLDFSSYIDARDLQTGKWIPTVADASGSGTTNAVAGQHRKTHTLSTRHRIVTGAIRSRLGS